MSFPSDHFLNQPRPNSVIGHGGDGSVDTTTLAAHDFDVDTRTGFMPPDPPISRLPVEWEPWETTLDRAMSMNLQLAVKRGLTENEIARSASWRESVHDIVSCLFTPVNRSSFCSPCCPNPSLSSLRLGHRHTVTHAFDERPCSF